ncbi:UdgX family uracil-DNA binding protein [Methylorubrum populi]|uniref:Type-4 uracil-DNA glycosylase n=2 Tax=Methylorubrum rhodesianum TaxID=29427 RepID=A0ABU9ZHA1_9HYPH|nr:UdgX family uracil-DNA binding protein [Methylorubrum rhodesianum]MBY0142948.1 UdgX family uracil-DNA binding protein [Methylorubrum populi]
MYVATLASEDDFDGWREAARGLVAAGVPASEVVWQVGDRPTDLFGSAPILAAQAPAFRLPSAFVHMLERVILHRDPERFGLLYGLLLRVVADPRVLHDQADPVLCRVQAMFQTIRRDMHKMRAFLRFREVETDGETRFVGWFEPEHHVVRANAAFFIGRYATMRWSILTPEVSVHWDCRTLSEGPGARRSDAPEGDPLEAVWKTYYRSIFNPARVMTGAMLKEMPRKYWKNMFETALVPELIAGAQAREAGMIERARTAPVQNGAKPWDALREEATGCRRCPLWKPATQTVFGQGPLDAEIMVVGEQPGDQEDLAGEPFVGPAGKVFDEAMTAAGIERSRVYVTNAVKHFKFEPRGKRRIHAKPGTGEIDACRWWVEQERAILRPRMTIAMGATAGRSLLGRAVTVGRERGRPLALPGGGEGWLTVHPSYLLRLPDKAKADQEFAAFVHDLRSAAARL